MKYTVIGIFDDTGVVYVEVVESEDPHGAMATVAAGDYPPSQILCAIPGEHDPVRACEDSGKAAYAEDLAADDDDPKGDDLCDTCMRSGVQISRTTDDGKTVCYECAKRAEEVG